MIQRKVCMLGAFAVGKTSLVARFVRGIFSEDYLTTVGVKIDRITVDKDGIEINLILWDIHGEDDFQKIRRTYTRGAGGFLIVVDGTRRETLETARSIHAATLEDHPGAPFLYLFNKADLEADWEVSPDAEAELESEGIDTMRTSAKTGDGVEQAFLSLTAAMLAKD